MSGLGFTHWGALAAIAVGVNFCTIDYADYANAQITPDGTLPNNTSVTREGGTFNITGGTQAGGNLFHSFGEFSVNTGGIASFNNAVDIQNIISRVTGGSVSNIDGIIRTLGTANLFLINPNGIVFGQNAQLNIGGSFVGSTASAISFGNQGFFSVSNPESSPSLLTVNPSALLFNQIQTASIQNNSIAFSGSNAFFNSVASGLRVPDGKSLLLVGGDIIMNGGRLYAFGGHIDLGGLKGAGTIGLNLYGNNLSLSFPNSVERSNVFLSRGAIIVATGDGGSIAINTQNLEMIGRSLLFSGIERRLDSDNSKAGNIEVNATGIINLNNSSITNQVFTASGQAGNININANTLLVKDGARVVSATIGAGKGGNLTVDAQDVQVIGTNTNGNSSNLSVSTQANSTGDAGDAGDLTIKTNTLLVKDGARVLAGTFGAGKGGNLTVDAQDVQIIGISANGNPSSLFASAYTNSTGDAGDLTIKTNSLLVKDGAWVSANTFGVGKGGNLTVDAQGVQIIGISANGQPPSILSASTQPDSTGDAGDLTVKTNTLLVKDGAQVIASTFGAGKGGNLAVDAQNVQIIGISAYDQVPSGLFALAQPYSTGNAGDLAIKTNSLLVKDGAWVSANTFGAGKGGNLTVDAQDVQIIGISANGNPSSLFASAYPDSTGDSGNLAIKTNSLLVKDGAWVSANTFGVGKGGNLTVDAQGVEIIGTSANGLFGSVLANSTEPGSTGNAGDLTIRTNTLLVKDGAEVSASTLGEGKGGSLTVDAQDVQIIGTSIKGNLSSRLVANTERNSTGNAGDLTIRTNTLLVKDGAGVSASTLGEGKGGNLTVDAQDVQIIGTSIKGNLSSRLVANTERNSTGNAGDLTIRTNTLLVKDGAGVSASTLGEGKGGNLTVDAQDVQIIGTSANNQFRSRLVANTERNSTGNAGDLTIRTNTLLVKDKAFVSASTFGEGKGGNLTVDAQDVQIIGTSVDGNLSSGLFASAQPGSTENGGDLTIKTNTLLVKDGGSVSASTFGGGKGGNLTVDAQDVQVIGTTADGLFSSGLFADAQSYSTGDAGNLTIKTNTLLLKDGAQVNVNTFGVGKGGNLRVDAQAVQIIGTSANKRFTSGLFASAQPGSTGNAGDLTIKTNTLLVEDKAQVNASTVGAGKGGNLTIRTNTLLVKDGAQVSTGTYDVGKGGNLRVDAKDVQIIGISADKIVSSLFADAQPNSTGNAGDLTIKTNTLLVKDGAQVGAGTFGAGKGGILTIDAQDVQIIGSSRLFADAQRNSIGNAGDLAIKTNTLLVRDGAQVSSATFGVGKGGNLTVDAQDVQIIGTSADNQVSSSLFADAQPNSTGDGGDLTIKTNTLLVQDGARIGVSTGGAGKGGNLSVDAQDVQLIGTSTDGLVASGLAADAQPNSTGDAGDLTIKTNTLLVQDEAAITVQSSGTGTAGSLIVDANSIYLNNAAEITADTTGGGGDIFLRSPLLLLRNQSSITTNARGSGIPGGNIKIDALNGFIIAVPNENSDISANSVDFRGGKVQISAQGIFGIQPRNTPTLLSDITATGASPEFSGSVELNTPGIDPNSGLVNLPTVAVDTQIAQGCYSPGYAQNSFIITGRGGLPPNPREAFSSNIVRPEWATLGPSNDINSQQTIKKNPPISTPPAPIVEATGWGTNAKGEIVLTANASNGIPHKNWQQSPVTCSSAKSADN
ncbi:Large exoprotein involved in heme utilization or adhesion [Nostoc flagelliforme CCNUN1]|uniref:Large exoprotein involved in heme utilization or adhesion n=2 Tax=Bacillati TaxID=1783272 RepID=A0A2K8T2W2_9NOSO|nr:filamentous hemagglutinin N-terminal domain-containing protein [Nostoc flagelliforme]AUB42042.1 Large exoprotein involved in heme utilization or adhesion [Nostoc flagelliforme CCNUN1]